MTTLILGVALGVFATAVMDAVNEALARAGVVVAIDHRMIGRVIRSWAGGRFAHRSPAAVPTFACERSFGYLAHYAIGVVFAVAFVGAWRALGGASVVVPAVAYGVLTTAAAYLLLFPSMGLGICGRRSPAGWRLPLTSLINHGVYGGGLALGLAVVGWIAAGR